MSFEVKEGKTFDLIKIDSKSGLSVIFMDVGAGVVEIKYDGAVMTVCPADLNVLTNYKPYYGKTIGRINGRVYKGHLDFDDITLDLQLNEGLNSLHGGIDAISGRRFEYEIEENENETFVEFEYLSPNGEAGYNGNVVWLVRYTLDNKKPSLRIDYALTPDQKTLLAPTNHLYFNLGADDSVLDHELMIEASKIMDVDNVDLHPIAPIEAPEYLDFRKGMKIGKYIHLPELQEHRAHGYDHPFIIDEDKRGGLIASVKGNGYKLECYSDLPCLIVYTNNYPSLGMPLTSGRTDALYAALTLECAEIPLDYKSMTVEKGETRRRYMEFVFGKE